MFVNHDTTQVLASKRAGTLRLSEDSHGLRVEADLPAIRRLAATWRI
jgi:phage head maturation protease